MWSALERNLFVSLGLYYQSYNSGMAQWPPLIPISQSVINNTSSPQSKNVAPITAFMGRPPTTPITKFLRTTTTAPITIEQLTLQLTVNRQELAQRMDDIHRIVQANLSREREHMRMKRGRGELANF